VPDLPVAFPVEGGCDCRFLRYRVETPPLFVHCCHCRWCQRESGSAFALNALIEADRVTALHGEPEMVRTPTASGGGQDIARCPQCRLAIWSNYAGTGPIAKFVRVGTLDEPASMPPDIHIYVESKQPWVVITPDVPTAAEYYERDSHWPAASLQRFGLLIPQIKAYRAALRAAAGSR
jgi:hypothetical protein